MNIRRKEWKSMATLATPKKGSYVIKKESGARITNSRAPKRITDRIKKHSAVFRSTNVK